MDVIVLAWNTAVLACCILIAGSIVFFGLRRFFKTFKRGVNQLEKMHAVPCSRCAYFTGDYRLKCTVNPLSALTEDAIGCLDYELADKSDHQYQVPACPRLLKR
ncbi:MAG: hypothetical protein AAFU53_01885 [Cyanobacteria bacterium J06632_3]